MGQLILPTRNPARTAEMTTRNSGTLRKVLGPDRSIAWKSKRRKWCRRIRAELNEGLWHMCIVKLPARLPLQQA
jgi:hypothetical protein